VYEAIQKVEPIKGLRWAFSHLDQVTETQLARMKRLGMYAGLHSRPLIQGALMHKVHGERAWDMPPFRRVQDSGIVWGLGSDATAVTTSNPFYTLWFAVTGRMIGSRKVNRQTISREEALIAHTRSNALFVFQESNLGSIQPGKCGPVCSTATISWRRHSRSRTSNPSLPWSAEKSSIAPGESSKHPTWTQESERRF
jgi:predicted amidohydrolase YtcJ